MEKEGNGTATPSPRSLAPAKKRGGAVSLLRAVMLAFRGNSSKKAPVIVDASTAVKTIVGGIRPLYQLDYQRRPPPPPPPPMALDSYYDVHLPPPSPCPSDAITSRYASAEDLQALDTSEDNEEGASSNGEVNAIDMKAEEFIAMFYQQMKLQRSDSLKMVEEEAIEQQSQSQPQSLKMIEEMVIEETAEGATRLQQEEKAKVEETAS